MKICVSLVVQTFVQEYVVKYVYLVDLEVLSSNVSCAQIPIAISGMPLLSHVPYVRVPTCCIIIPEVIIVEHLKHSKLLYKC